MQTLGDALNQSNSWKVKLTKIKFNCPKHGEVDVSVLGDPDNHSEGYCPFCLEEQEKEETKRREMSFEKEKMINNWIESNIEKEFINKELNDYIPNTETQKQALIYTKKIIEKKNGKLILLGSNGVGKTFLGSMIVKSLGGAIYSMYEISTMIRQSYSNNSNTTELEIVRWLASLPCLVIDEIGRSKGSIAETNWLSFILDKRHTRNLPTIILSNTHLKRDCLNKGCDYCFENFFGNDILSRFQQNTKIITIKGDDYRRLK